jgi:transcriptional regulator with GAF, ATPase, and Fis domain
LSAFSSPVSSSPRWGDSPTATPSSTPVASPKVPGFAELDERLRTGASGALFVQVAGPGAAEALASHAVRCARSLGANVLQVRGRASGPAWRDIAVRLGITSLDCSPRPCAEQIAAVASSHLTVVVTPIPWIGSWDRSVAAEICAIASVGSTGTGLLTVFVSDGGDAARDLLAERFEIATSLDAVERTKWWSAIAQEADGVVSSSDLGALHGWWEFARRTPLDVDPPSPPVSAEGETLLSSLAAVGRPWPLSEVAALSENPRTLDEIRTLVHLGLVEVERGWILLATPADDERLEPAQCSHVAHALSAHFSGDGWAVARAAELLLRASDFEQADAQHAAALTLIDDSAARQEIIGRWMTAVTAVPEEAQLRLRMRSAERALAIGEADEAHRWAQSAAIIAPEDPNVTLLLGRSSVAMGDLVAARVTLERGREAATSPKMAALIAVELSEVAYLSGEFAEAAAEAERVLELTREDPAQSATTLRARNTLGKLLLARSSWTLADKHFTEDAPLAMAHGQHTAELRARLNRGIALMSSGSLDEARAIFDAVYAEGERIGDSRACAFALDNLSVVATWRHEYASALNFSERTLNLRQRLGDKLTMARILGNLAELRRKLGLFDHAEHAIAFGRRAIGPGMPPERSAHFSFVAARLALARGRTAEAAREVARALADGETAGHATILGEAHRVATRIALDDGDVARAHACLDRSIQYSQTDDARAEVALLSALLARAEGRDAEALAIDALALCRTAGEEELLREVHILLCELYRNAGKLHPARVHLEQAAALRDEIARDLPNDVRVAFLARTDVVALGRLQTLLLEPEGARLEEEPATRRPAPHAREGLPREIVGDDPAIRGLQVAIRKVARANSTVLIRGESGTGKELVAEALHRASGCADGPLVTVNCAALVETLLLSELFGHEKGAFTGAVSRRRGRFELAEGGTLFLDEIGDISQKTQVALLRVLQERTFERVGGTTPVRANVRIICATHRDLKAMVERGEFREDLYYRLRGITLEVPALRTRMGDLPRIAEHLLARIALERGEPTKTLSAEAVTLLGRHKWPGNVRELENALRAASLFADGSTITGQNLLDNVDDLRNASARGPESAARTSERPSDRPAPLSSNSLTDVSGLSSADLDEGDESAAECDPLPATESNATAVAYSQVRQGSVSLSEMKRQIERDCIARALAETRGNITRAAALLGMKRPRLSQLVKQYGFAAVSSED